MINLFLDDLLDDKEREKIADLLCRDAPSNNFVVARNVNDALYILQKCKVNILSLDHDLGDNKSTGYDLVKVLVEYYMFGELTIFPKEIYLHTANPVGRDNMYQLLIRYKPDDVKVYKCPIVCD